MRRDGTTRQNIGSRLGPGILRSLQELEDQAAFDLAYVDYPSHAWVCPRGDARGGEVRDVVIVGGGMGGMAVAFLLMRHRILNIQVIDRNPQGLEGPWLTYARMAKLRTPKELVGPDCGLSEPFVPKLAVDAARGPMHGGKWGQRRVRCGWTI